MRIPAPENSAPAWISVCMGDQTLMVSNHLISLLKECVYENANHVPS